jgi:glycosyltransferase involved in cell wall biosynthesis
LIHGKNVFVVLPAYNAHRTLERTVAVAESLGITVIVHPRNRGYGGNQKTCYTEALQRNADIVVMVHPDYQYDPRMVTAMAGMVATGIYDMVIGSRILGGGALAGGMPLWRYVANRILTTFQNLLIGGHLSEYHSGYRAYARSLLDALPWSRNSDDFVFDNEILAQTIVGGYRVGEVSVPTRYFAEASSINFVRAVRYGVGVVGTTLLALLARMRIYRHPMFNARAPTDRPLGYDL